MKFAEILFWIGTAIVVVGFITEIIGIHRKCDSVVLRGLCIMNAGGVIVLINGFFLGLKP